MFHKIRNQLHSFPLKQQLSTAIIIAITIVVLASIFNTTKSTSASIAMLNNSVTNQSALLATENSVTVYTDLDSMEEQTLSEESLVTITEYFTLETDQEDILLATIELNSETFYVEATNLELVQANEINSYIAQMGYPHVEMSEDIETMFEQEAYTTESGNPIGIIIHDTGVDYSTIDNEVAYMIENYAEEGVFVHSFIDNDTILEIADASYKAQGAGPNGNSSYIQFEMTHVYTQDDFAMQLANAAYYTAYMLSQYNLPVTVGDENGGGSIWTHEMVSIYLGGTDHIDPTAYWDASASELFATTYDVDDFAQLVQAYYNMM
ncbi:TPA: N-acetylmuramoyl-L-alanine amidase [Streptococcus suis]|nr:N-acetylmuramoyl-L-alanine amidase [Streptococcus suis]HEM4403068.1 N-acetylmuramoyl-L-alanine amidase [Streptococcus suis]